MNNLKALVFGDAKYFPALKEGWLEAVEGRRNMILLERVSTWWEGMAKAKARIGSVVKQKNRTENTFDWNKMLVVILEIFWCLHSIFYNIFHSILISKFTSEMAIEACGDIKGRQ